MHRYVTSTQRFM